MIEGRSATGPSFIIIHGARCRVDRRGSPARQASATATTEQRLLVKSWSTSGIKRSATDGSASGADYFFVLIDRVLLYTE